MLKKLATLKLVVHEPYRGAKLTPAGRKAAVEVIRHHRLLEQYLAETLGMPIDEVHAEADRLEHALSEELEARIDETLGFPTHDPHGDPIPDAALNVGVDTLRPLPCARRGGALDHSPSPGRQRAARYLRGLGLLPGRRGRARSQGALRRSPSSSRRAARSTRSRSSSPARSASPSLPRTGEAVLGQAGRSVKRASPQHANSLFCRRFDRHARRCRRCRQVGSPVLTVSRPRPAGEARDGHSGCEERGHVRAFREVRGWEDAAGTQQLRALSTGARVEVADPGAGGARTGASDSGLRRGRRVRPARLSSSGISSPPRSKSSREASPLASAAP